MQTFLEFQSLLTDSLDSPLPYRWHRKTSDQWTGTFKIPSGETYQCDIMKWHSKEWIVRFGVWEGVWPMTHTQMKFDIVGGTREEFHIFATVIAMIKEFIQVKQPNVLLFSAKEPSRQGLYRRFMSRVSKVLPKYRGSELSRGDPRGGDTPDARFMISRVE